jgi:hypothetical protein
MPDRHRHYARLAGAAGGADTNKDVSGAAFRFRHAAALEDRLPRGARVQMLDSDYGAFLAMARAGMRQATPHIQWFSLVFAEGSVRQEFLAALEDNPPAAILLTNSQWPQPHGFDAADRWPKFAALLASRYVLDRSKNENGIAWRLYLRRARAVSAIAPTPKASSSTPST